MALDNPWAAAGPGGPVAVVTGANRGIGLEIARQLARRGARVVLCARDADKAEGAAAALAREGLLVQPRALEVTDGAQVEALADFLSVRHGGADILVNNAGVMLDPPGSSHRELSRQVLEQTLRVNLHAPLALAQALAPMMAGRGGGRIINLSSGLGQLADMAGGTPAYRMSKAALNALTRILAAELAGEGIAVNALCPGWVRTDMGGPEAPRTVEQGADTAVWLALEAPPSVSGGFWRDRQPIPW